jgi:hypothetical protein
MRKIHWPQSNYLKQATNLALNVTLIFQPIGPTSTASSKHGSRSMTSPGQLLWAMRSVPTCRCPSPTTIRTLPTKSNQTHLVPKVSRVAKAPSQHRTLRMPRNIRQLDRRITRVDGVFLKPLPQTPLASVHIRISRTPRACLRVWLLTQHTEPAHALTRSPNLATSPELRPLAALSMAA